MTSCFNEVNLLTNKDIGIPRRIIIFFIQIQPLIAQKKIISDTNAFQLAKQEINIFSTKAILFTILPNVY